MISTVSVRIAIFEKQRLPEKRICTKATVWTFIGTNSWKKAWWWRWGRSRFLENVKNYKASEKNLYTLTFTDLLGPTESLGKKLGNFY